MTGKDDALPIDIKQMRDVMGLFGSGVTIITALADGEPIGFTCQSFFSLSLEPALVAFAPSRSSTTWPKIREIGRFGINVLSEHHSTVADAFAVSGADKFAGVAWSPSDHGNPLLDRVLAYVDGELWAEYDGGDHTIVAARVLALHAEHDRPPLIRHRGRYGVEGASSQGLTGALAAEGRQP